MTYNFLDHKKRAVRKWETKQLAKLLEEHGFCIARTADNIGMNRSNLARKLGELGIKHLVRETRGGDRKSQAYKDSLQ